MRHLMKYLKQVSGVSHTTINPNSNHVIRIHLVPPLKPKPGLSWIVIINGQDILPISVGWAVLLRELIREINEHARSVFTEDDVEVLLSRTVVSAQGVFPKTKVVDLRNDLTEIIQVLFDIAEGKVPSREIGYMTFKEYGKYMPAPHRMDLMLSSMMNHNGWNCNQKCLHCYAGSQKYAVVNEMSTEEWKKVIDKCKEAAISQLTFTGGEPTLRTDLVELVKYSEWFVTRLNTNGIKLSKTLCEELYVASLDAVQVTLYSHKESIHNFLVGSNHFNETITGIKNAVSTGLNVSINTPLCSLNKDYLDMVKYAYEELGVKSFTCSGLIVTGNAENTESKETSLTSEELLKILTEVKEYTEERKIYFSFTTPGLVDEKDLVFLDLMVPSCGACLSNMAIAPDGSVIPCQSWLSDEPLGNLLVDEFKTIWKSSKCKKIRNESLKVDHICQLSKKGGAVHE